MLQCTNDQFQISHYHSMFCSQKFALTCIGYFYDKMVKKKLLTLVCCDSQRDHVEDHCLQGETPNWQKEILDLSLLHGEVLKWALFLCYAEHLKYIKWNMWKLMKQSIWTMKYIHHPKLHNLVRLKKTDSIKFNSLVKH